MRIAHPAKSGDQIRRGGALAATLCLASCLVGCAQLDRAIQPPPVNPSSPIAPYAEEVSHETFPTPKFSDVPPKPTDVRSPAAYKAAVIHEVEFRRELAQWRATHPDLNSDTEAWADLQRHRIPKSTSTPVSTEHDAEADAFAKRLREEAGKSPPSQ